MFLFEQLKHDPLAGKPKLIAVPYLHGNSYDPAYFLAPSLHLNNELSLNTQPPEKIYEFQIT